VSLSGSNVKSVADSDTTGEHCFSIGDAPSCLTKNIFFFLTLPTLLSAIFPLSDTTGRELISALLRTVIDTR
jgi:hypothetical protein